MPRRATSDPLRVVVADDDPGFAELLAAIVDANPRCEVVGIASDGEEALQLSIWQDADIVLMRVAEARAAGAFAYIPKRNAAVDVERMLRVIERGSEASA
jgi:chemotaxis response regulator CheB